MNRPHHGKGIQERAPRKRKPRPVVDLDNDKQATVFEDVDAPIRPVTEKQLQVMQEKAERRKRRLEKKKEKAQTTSTSSSIKSVYSIKSSESCEKLDYAVEEEVSAIASTVNPFTARSQWKADPGAQSTREKVAAVATPSPHEKGRRVKRRSRKDSAKRSHGKVNTDELPTPITASREVIATKSSSESIFSSPQAPKEKFQDGNALELDKTWPDEEECALATELSKLEVEDHTQSDREIGKP
ncbi:unnamed protein product [Bursaphelenchus xylophilus]|uniref:(pine wood nematode) hypothetical protein n=1 Tax=Bursaphelenchus xylophilus TaxID=6326 RepID=A0A1I7SER0_BURXY|nr:unnamed protein product [Bursaphelenchus xylophilus]CAG9128267.1 unnamed protein product [Bursaphelenchus xylophilus]